MKIPAATRGGRRRATPEVRRLRGKLARRASGIERARADRKRMEEALGAANEKLQVYARIVDNAPDLITVIDRNYLFRIVNPAYSRFRGLAPEQIVGRPVGDVLGEELFREVVRPEMERCFAGETVRFETWLPNPAPGPRYMEVNYYPLPTGPEGRVELLAVVLRDMTERKHAEDQREDFLRLVSHDLRSPLVGIGGFAQVLLRQFEKSGASEADMKYLKFIAVGAERMTAIIQDLVDLVQLEGGQAEIRAQAVALTDFVRDYLERATVTLDVGRVITDLPADLPPVASDPSRLERILTNLLSNALKYSPCEAPVHLAAESAGGEVLISVTDEGPGIAPEDIPRLFDRFYRCKTARKREGLGLGLYIAKMLVEAQGGRIWVASEPERGSAFRFTLPVAGGSGVAS